MKNTTLYTRKCPKCNKTIIHKNKNTYRLMVKRNSQCRRCADDQTGKKISKTTKGVSKKPFSEEHIKNLTVAHKNSKKWHDSMNTDEYKNKHRCKMIRMIKENKTSVAYNTKACEVFNFINEKLNWNGVHGKNEKEKRIEMFFLDYYYPDLNVVIEWDEKHHKKNKEQIKDLRKQTIIMKILNCEFYRIDDISKKIKKIDNGIIDRMENLQKIINNYYETEK